MNSKVTPEGLGAAVNDILEAYTETLTEDCNKSAADLAKYGAEELKQKAASAGIGGRKYKNSFRWQLLKESPFGNIYVIRSTQYRIAHLLEHGHIIVSHGKYTGKRTRARHHWTEVEQDVESKLLNAVAEAIKKQNRG